MISGRYAKYALTFQTRWLVPAALLALIAASPTAFGQFGVGFGTRIGGVVGGVSVDADGTVRSATAQERSGLLDELRKQVKHPGGDLATKTQLRMVSLSKLQAEIASAMAERRVLSEEVLFLAGLQRIEYVFVFPEQKDIVIAGPAEGWVVREDATVVGETTGKPVIHLEDLITAMRATSATQQMPMSVSIDPTPEGEIRLRKLLGQLRVGPGFDPARVEPALKEAFGPQQVSLKSVPENSRMASTLVAADYRMKRLAMNLEESPVQGMPSYMEMVRNGGASQNTQPRWWMACDYDAIFHSEDGLAWKLDGRGVKAMTEEEIVADSGRRQQTGRTNRNAQRWADMFTEKFDELCAYNTAFGDLRNVMDLNIVATLIKVHDLEGVGGCDFGLLKGTGERLDTPTYATPKTIVPECSFVRGSAGWVVSASGGVEINPWKVLGSLTKPDRTLADVRDKIPAPADNKWWWN